MFKSHWHFHFLHHIHPNCAFVLRMTEDSPVTGCRLKYWRQILIIFAKQSKWASLYIFLPISCHLLTGMLRIYGSPYMSYRDPIVCYATISQSNLGALFSANFKLDLVREMDPALPLHLPQPDVLLQAGQLATYGFPQMNVIWENFTKPFFCFRNQIFMNSMNF